jgi:N-acetylglucosaminyldiphosphoundecaprenol N-acetyl-beta-D-mannosaminyltransferase
MEILGVKIDNLTKEEALEKIEEFLEDNQQHYLVTPNPEFLVRAQEDEEFRRILNQADLAMPDGIGLIFASRLLGQPLKERVIGVDLMEKICQRAAQKKWSVFLLGGQEGVAEKAAENLRKRYQGLKIEFGNSSPSFEQQPIILFVALGAPKQEKWIVQNLEKIPSVKLAIGVGGAFDFISGRVRRAPKLFRLLGLEWFWRLLRQPWRVSRIFNALVRFPWLVLKSKFF